MRLFIGYFVIFDHCHGSFQVVSSHFTFSTTFKGNPKIGKLGSYGRIDGYLKWRTFGAFLNGTRQFSGSFTTFGANICYFDARSFFLFSWLRRNFYALEISALKVYHVGFICSSEKLYYKEESESAYFKCKFFFTFWNIISKIFSVLSIIRKLIFFGT